jgi:hypothetical protein
MGVVGPPLRLTLVAVGLAVVVYGIASLTGGWLGTPPWWEVWPTEEDALLPRPPPYFQGVGGMEGGPWLDLATLYTPRPRPGREWISAAVIAVGLAVGALGAWPPSPSTSAALHGVLRIPLAAVGLAASVYGAASLTGGWLGTPPWWEVRARFVWPSLERMEEDSVSDESDGWSGNRGLPLIEPRPGREWISGGVMGAGLGLLAIGAWPHRRRTTAES